MFRGRVGQQVVDVRLLARNSSARPQSPHGFTPALHRFLGLRLTDLQGRALMGQVDLFFTKETSVSFIRQFSRIGVALMVGLSLSGCVIRPLLWGDGHRHGEHREYGADYRRAPSDGHSRYDSERGR
jgi:hypothetical protein